MNRATLGKRVGIVGVFANCALFILKFIMGTAANSIAIITDSFNNLIDCTSSFITIVGFHISGREKNEKHPFGLGRIEYISGFLIALLIIFAAFSLGKTSFLRLLDPEPLKVSTIMFLVPMASILIKTCLIYYITRINRMLDSSALRAAVREDYADILITFLTVFTLLVAPHTNLPIDGIVGLIIAVFILWSGLSALSENMDLLIGKGADKALETDIRNMLMEYNVFDDMLSFSIHDYGPNTKIAVIQVSLLKDKKDDDKRIGEAVSQSVAKLRNTYGLKAIIYWNPMKELTIN
ncbi:MAG: cation transporter [Firmicutes bacterium]|nr:cation transporter [Bacillota bacterium]